jgi:uncharacterized protein (TIGR02996 family)
MSSPKHVTELLATQRFEAALDALLAAWRAHRAPQLEGPIASLSKLLSAGVDPIDEEDEDWQEQWDRRARAKRSVELGVLLPHVTRLPKNGIPPRVRGLLEFGGDPRIGALLVEIIETPPLTASSNFAMWTALFAALPEHVDARARARLEARIATRGGSSNFWTKLEAWVKAVLPKLPEPAPLPKGWKAELTELERAIAALAKGPAPDLRVAAIAESPVSSLTTVNDLAEVRRVVEQGELAEALDLLVAYWAQRRSPTIAALIDRLGLLVDEQQQAPTGKTQKARQAAWMEAAERPRPSAIGPLLASLRDAQLTDVEARIEAMIDWQPDPRVARAMQLLSKDHMLGARNRLWKAVYDVLVHHADPRVAEDVRERHERLHNARVLHRHIAEGRELRRVFEAFTAAVEADHALTSDQDEHAEAIAARLAAQVDQQSDDADVERKLVEAIVAAWDDDGPRLVYSDWLQTRKDARGEFIALDLALTQGKKVKGAREKYFKANKDALIGPLAGVLSWGEKFDRGCLDLARITTRKGGLDIGEDQRRELLGDLRWALIRSLHVDADEEDVAAVLAHAPLLALQRLSGVSPALLRSLARREDSLPVRTLEISASSSDAPESWQQLDALVRVLPSVESIEIVLWKREGGRATPPIACFRSALVRRAQELVCGNERTGGVSRLDEWLERMIASECSVKLVKLIGPELSAEVRQLELGRFEIALTLDRLRWPQREENQHVLAAVRGLPRGNIDSLRLKLGDVNDELRSAIDAALASVNVAQ